MKTSKKHTSRKLKSRVYLYRNHRIEWFDYATLGDWTIKVKQWNIYPPDAETWTDFAPTLSEAKDRIDESMPYADVWASLVPIEGPRH